MALRRCPYLASAGVSTFSRLRPSRDLFRCLPVAHWVLVSLAMLSLRWTETTERVPACETKGLRKRSTASSTAVQGISTLLTNSERSMIFLWTPLWHRFQLAVPLLTSFFETGPDVFPQSLWLACLERYLAGIACHSNIVDHLLGV